MHVRIKLLAAIKQARRRIFGCGRRDAVESGTVKGSVLEL